VSFRDAVEYAGYSFASAMTRILPLSLLYGLCRAFGSIAWHRGGKQARIAKENLRIAFPNMAQEERDRIGRESFVEFSRNTIDFLRAERWDAETLRAHTDLVGMQHYVNAAARGKGVFFLTLHLGNFEIMCRRATLDGLGMLVIGRPMRNQLLYGRIRKSREAYGAKLADRDNAAPEMLRYLRKNSIIAVLNDHYTSISRGIMVPFFGVLASTSPGVAMLAIRTGAAVCPAFTVRDEDGIHRSEILPALDFELSGDRKADIEAVTGQCNAALEAIIRQYPEQWLWSNRRFRHSPDLVGDGYTDRVKKHAVG